MDRLDALLTAEDVPVRAERVPVDADDLERIRANRERGVEAWVSAVVVDDAGRVLLVRNRWSDGWIPPGGSVEPDEDLRAAVAREVREETGVTAAVGRPVAVVEETFECDDRAVAGHRVAFAADARTTALADDPGLDGEGIEDVGWFGTLPDRMEQRWLVELGWGEGP